MPARRPTPTIPTGERDHRLWKQTQATSDDPRSPARHDRDRVYYSGSFRRLAGVTQVLTPDPEGYLLHNRLTHSLKVSQVARSIAEVLKGRANRRRINDVGGLDADVVETAALAHDLGHPPFGHIGEQVLDRYAREKLGLREGFEGNAQSFRIAVALEPRSADFVGLDLTTASRCAILKYPWARVDRYAEHVKKLKSDRDYRLQWKKFGYYESEIDAFLDARTILPDAAAKAQSLEAAIMDAADDITYALHDLEDFHGAGTLRVSEAMDEIDKWRETHGGAAAPVPGDDSNEDTFEQLRSDLLRNYPEKFESGEGIFEEALGAVYEHLVSLRNQSDSISHRNAVSGTRQLASKLITIYIGGISLNADSLGMYDPPIRFELNHWYQIQILKHITQHFIISRPDVAVVQRGQQALLRGLLGSLKDWEENDPKRLPRSLRETLGKFGERALIDYVAGLSDHQAMSLHRGLTGSDPSAVLRTIPAV